MAVGCVLALKARGNWLLMTITRKLAALCGAAGIALIAISGTAAADGYEVAAPAPAEGANAAAAGNAAEGGNAADAATTNQAATANP